MNRSLGNLLICLTKQHGQAWDLVSGQEDYAYNDSVNRSTCQSPFEIVYGCHPRGISKLRDLSMDNRSAQGENFEENMKEIHEQVKKTFQLNNDKYKT